MSESRPARGATDGRYYPALDGVRALSMIVIFVFHIDGGAIPGGYIAVDVFFVLSGFIRVRRSRSDGRRPRDQAVPY